MRVGFIPLGMQWQVIIPGIMKTILRKLSSILLLLMLAQRIVVFGLWDVKI